MKSSRCKDPRHWSVTYANRGDWRDVRAAGKRDHTTARSRHGGWLAITVAWPTSAETSCTSSRPGWRKPRRFWCWRASMLPECSAIALLHGRSRTLDGASSVASWSTRRAGTAVGFGWRRASFPAPRPAWLRSHQERAGSIGAPLFLRSVRVGDRSGSECRAEFGAAGRREFNGDHKNACGEAVRPAPRRRASEKQEPSRKCAVVTHAQVSGNGTPLESL